MIYCKVLDGFVTDRAVFDGTMPDDWPNKEMWIENEVAQVGWEHDGVEFIQPVSEPPIDESPYFPDLTSRQFWLAALEAGVTKAGLISNVNSAFSGPDLEYYLIEIKESTSFSRSNPMVDILSAMNGFSPSQIDDLWRRSASI